MTSNELGAHGAPGEEKIQKQGGDKDTSPAAAVRTKSRRSPAYAAFEQLDPETLEGNGDATKTEDFDRISEEYEKTISIFEEGQIVAGSVTEIRENEIIVDVGFKSEGTIPIHEFRDRAQVNIGDQLDVFLEKLENQDGLVVLSKEKADFLRVWDHIKDGYDSGNIMDGRVARRIKGGLVVDLLGVDAFLPGSQIALRQVPNLDELIGQTLSFKIIKINKRRRNIVVSRRIVLEEERASQKKTLLSELEVGQVREGVVKNITDFGAFVDLGGVDGLLHLTDMTWGRIGHPSEVVNIGDQLEVKVLDFDKEKEKISLGLKQLTPHPWDGVEERFIVGERVKGTVVSITDYGAFVELEQGVEGLIHISEMSWTRHVKHPSKILSIGDAVEAVVLKVDKDSQKISLGLKQTEPDPWTTIEEKYPVGTRIHGKVRNLTNFGAFVEIEEGIDGLLHISDMSWAKRVRHPSEVVKKSDDIEVVVLDISQDKKRISLGLKQLLENPWETLATEFAVDTVTEGKVTRLLDRGAVVELRDDVEGFVPIGQMGIADIRHPEDHFSLSDVLPIKVIKIDPKNKRIVLSVSAYLKSLSDEETAAFRERFPLKERPAPGPAEADAGAEGPGETTEPQTRPAESTDAPATGAAEPTPDTPSEPKPVEAAPDPAVAGQEDEATDTIEEGDEEKQQ